MGKKNNLGKICPECEAGYLYSVNKTEIHNGKDFQDKYIECSNCDYHEKFINKRNKIKYEE